MLGWPRWESSEEIHWFWNFARVSGEVGCPAWSRWTWVFKNLERLGGVSITHWKSGFTDLRVYFRLEGTSFFDGGGVCVDLFWRWPKQDLPWLFEDFSLAWKNLVSKYSCVWCCDFWRTGGIRRNCSETWWGWVPELLEVAVGVIGEKPEWEVSSLKASW